MVSCLLYRVGALSAIYHILGWYTNTAMGSPVSVIVAMHLIMGNIENEALGPSLVY